MRKMNRSGRALAAGLTFVGLLATAALIAYLVKMQAPAYVGSNSALNEAHEVLGTGRAVNEPAAAETPPTPTPPAVPAAAPAPTPAETKPVPAAAPATQPATQPAVPPQRQQRVTPQGLGRQTKSKVDVHNDDVNKAIEDAGKE